MSVRCSISCFFSFVLFVSVHAETLSKLSASESTYGNLSVASRPHHELRDVRRRLETLSEILLAIRGTSIPQLGDSIGVPGKLLRSHVTDRMHHRARTVEASVTSERQRRAAVVGAGPAGLLSAIMLARRGWSVSVYDSRQPPPPPDDPQWGSGERSYQLGLNGRGQKSLREFEAFECVSKHSAEAHGRLGYDEKEKRFKELPSSPKSYITRVLQRDRLQACLFEELSARYPQVSVNWGVGCDGVDLDGDKPVLRLCASDGESCDIFNDISPGSPVDLVVGADGVRSSVRESIAGAPGSNTRTIRYANTNEQVYRSLSLHPSAVAGTPTNMSWEASNKTKGFGMNALPTKEGEMAAVILFKPGSPVSKEIEALATGSEAREYFAETLPSILPYCTDDSLESFVKRPTSRLPSFQLVKGDISKTLRHGSVALLGDSIKAVKPYFGQGANSALEDVSVLARCLEASGDNPVEAAKLYTRARAEDARALVRTSRSFDMPGKLGTARFVVPLILDSLLNKFLPALFSPSMLSGLQDERNTFIGLRWKKRRERAMLLGILASFALPKHPFFVLKSVVGASLVTQLVKMLQQKVKVTR